MKSGNKYYADEIGVLKWKQEPRKAMISIDVGCTISEIKEVKVGDTITSLTNKSTLIVDER